VESKSVQRDSRPVCRAAVIAFIAFVTSFGGPSAPAWAAPAPLVPASDGSSRVSFFLEPILQKNLGGSSYDLSSNLGGGYTALSRLEFPQLALEAGLAAGLSVYQGEKREFLVEASATYSVLGFAGSMNDYDWTQYLGYPEVPFSYTYSQDSTVSWHVSVETAFTIAFSKPWSLAAYGMYRYQDVSHVENGYTGWQYVLDTATGEYVPTIVYGTTPDVLEYELSSDIIGLGLLGEVEPFPGFSLELRGAFAPVYVSDRDDHKLRTKLSTASGWGTGLYSDMRATLVLNRSPGVTPYLSLEGEVIYYVVSTTQTQYWYGNTDTVPQGTLITGVGHVITNAQYEVGLRFGLMF